MLTAPVYPVHSNNHGIPVPPHFKTLPVSSEKNGGERIVHISQVHKFRYFSIHANAVTWAIVMDIDFEDSIERLFLLIEAGVPLPSWVLHNFANGHVQAGWIIEHVSHGQRSHIKPQKFLADITLLMEHIFECDPGFTRGRVQNPFWEGLEDFNKTQVKRTIGSLVPYTLNALADGIKATGLWVKPSTLREKPLANLKPVPEDAVDSRNVSTFHHARRQINVERAANNINSSFPNPMSATELDGIVRSIERYRAKHGYLPNGTGKPLTDQERKRLSARGKYGGSRNTDAQKEVRKKGTAAAAVVRSAEATLTYSRVIELSQKGYTRREIMAELSVSESTVKRALRSAKK